MYLYYKEMPLALVIVAVVVKVVIVGCYSETQTINVLNIRLLYTVGRMHN